jgi:hypothetical protein
MYQQRIEFDMKESLYKELQSVLKKFPTYNKVFKPTTANESLHEISNDSRVKVVNFTHSKAVKSTMFPHHNFLKFTWTSPDGKA